MRLDVFSNMEADGEAPGANTADSFGMGSIMTDDRCRDRRDGLGKA